jgi:hypothetical protein
MDSPILKKHSYSILSPCYPKVIEASILSCLVPWIYQDLDQQKNQKRLTCFLVRNCLSFGLWMFLSRRCWWSWSLVLSFVNPFFLLLKSSFLDSLSWEVVEDMNWMHRQNPFKTCLIDLEKKWKMKWMNQDNDTQERNKRIYYYSTNEKRVARNQDMWVCMSWETLKLSFTSATHTESVCCCSSQKVASSSSDTIANLLQDGVDNMNARWMCVIVSTTTKNLHIRQVSIIASDHLGNQNVVTNKPDWRWFIFSLALQEEKNGNGLLLLVGLKYAVYQIKPRVDQNRNKNQHLNLFSLILNGFLVYVCALLLNSLLWQRF